jgi:hypothetical protein
MDDLLDSHTLVTRVGSPEQCELDDLLHDCTNADEFSLGKQDDPYVFTSLFRFDTPCIRSGVQYNIQHRFIWSSNITYKAQSTDAFIVTLLLNTTQSSKTVVSALLRTGVIVGGGYDASSYYDFEVGTTYAMTIEFYYKTSGTYFKVFISEIDGVTLVYPPVITIESTALTGAASSSYFSDIQTYEGSWASGGYFIGTYRMYELQYSGVGVSNLGMSPWLITFAYSLYGQRRTLEYVYYVGDDNASYLLPPNDIADGAPYAYTAILNEKVEDVQDTVDAMEIVIDDLTADLATANSTIDDLTDALDDAKEVIDAINGNVVDVIIVNIVTMMQDIGDIISDLADILSALADAAEDIISDILSDLATKLSVARLAIVDALDIMDGSGAKTTFLQECTSRIVVSGVNLLSKISGGTEYEEE